MTRSCSRLRAAVITPITFPTHSPRECPATPSTWYGRTAVGQAVGTRAGKSAGRNVQKTCGCRLRSLRSLPWSTAPHGALYRHLITIYEFRFAVV